MSAPHIEFLVEEPSIEAFLRSWLPRYLPDQTTFDVKVFQGKSDLLANLERRLRGYAAWLPDDWRIVVVVDRDDDDCIELKRGLEDICARAGFGTRRMHHKTWRVATCLAIEELEAWYFGDWSAVVDAFPRVSRQIVSRSRYRAPDSILGGTWEAFEQVMKRHGYFSGGLEKIRAAREIGNRIVASRNLSPSFQHLVRVIDGVLQ